MELRLLKAFVTLAEVRSFKRAASMLHMSQPTLSRQIARLETELGTRLFERYGRHVDFTPDGKFLFPLAEALIARADNTYNLMRVRAGVESSPVRIGATGMVLAHLLLPILSTFVVAHPSAKLDIVDRDDEWLEQAVFDGIIDCAIVTSWETTRVATKHLFREEIFLLVPRNHPLAGASAVSLKELAREVHLFPETHFSMSKVLSDACRNAGFEPKIGYRANYPELLKALVRTGWGVLTLPETLLNAGGLEGLVVVPFQERMFRDLVLIYAWDLPLSTTTRAIMTHIQAHMPSIGAELPSCHYTSDRSRRPRRSVDRN